MAVAPAESRLVERLPLFVGLGRQQFARLLRFATIQRYPAGTALFHEGEEPNSLHVLISGTVEVYSNGNEREWGAMLMNAGDVFMPGSVLFNEPYLTSARTLGCCRLLLIDAAAVRDEAATTAQFAIHLSRAMAGQFRAAMRQVVDLKSRSAGQRLGSFLLKVVDNSSSPIPELPMRKRSLAARIGMTPETLSRTLQTLAGHGLVVRGRQILVRDRARIEAFCGPDPYRPDAEDRLEVHVL